MQRIFVSRYGKKVNHSADTQGTSEKECRNPERPWWQSSTLWTAIATVIIAIFTVVLSIVGIYQGLTNSGQLNEMRHQTETTRAQIRADIDSEGQRINRVVSPTGQVLGWDVNPVWKNVGGTDAREYVNWFNFDFIPGGLKSPKDCPKAIKPENFLSGPLVLTPSQTLIESANRLPIDRVNAVLKGEGDVIMVGHLQYVDIFPDDPPHHFDWCILVAMNDPAHDVFSFINQLEDVE